MTKKRMETASRICKTCKSFGFIERFLENAAKYPDHTAIVFEETDKKTTYAEMLDLMERFKGIFLEQSVSKGDVVAFILPTGKEFIAAFYGLASISATALFINPQLTEYEIGLMLTDSRPSQIVTSAKKIAAIGATIDKCDSIKKILLVDRGSSTHVETRIRPIWLEDFKERASSLSAPLCDFDVTCHYTYKGLGFPLGVRHTYHNYSLCLEGWEGRFAYNVGDVGLAVLPIYPILGTILLMMTPLSQCSKIVIVTNVKRLMKNGVINLLEKHQIRFTSLIPIFVKKMLKEASERGDGATYNFNPEMIITCGGEFLKPKVIAELYDATGIEILQGYGVTEAQIVCVVDKGETKRGSIGTTFCRDTKMLIVDSEGKEAKIGQVGDVVIVGPTVAETYFGEPDGSERFLTDDLLFTGDLGYKDEDNHVFFTGRSIPIAKASAQMVDLKEIDGILNSHPTIEDTRTTNVGDDGENKISSTVVVREGSSATPNELKAYIGKFLSKHKIPTEIVIERPHQGL